MASPDYPGRPCPVSQPGGNAKAKMYGPAARVGGTRVGTALGVAGQLKSKGDGEEAESGRVIWRAQRGARGFTALGGIDSEGDRSQEVRRGADRHHQAGALACRRRRAQPSAGGRKERGGA